MNPWMALGPALATIVLSTAAGAAEEDVRVPAILPDDVVAWICTIEDDAFLMAVRKFAGGWRLIGTRREHQVFEHDGEFTILLGASVLQVAGRRFAMLEGAESRSGSCKRAELELDYLLSDLR